MPTQKNACFVGPNAVFTNDLTPRAKLFRDDNVVTLVKEGASIGANASIRCGITVGRWAMVGMGSVATDDVMDFAIVYGVPARHQGWACVCGKRLDLPLGGSDQSSCVCGRSYTLREGKVTAALATFPEEC